MRDLALGIDCSTTAVKVVAWGRDGKAAAEGRAPLDQLPLRPPSSEQRADDWWEATQRATTELMRAVDTDRIAGICVTHQRESFVPVDERCQALRNAILWDDARSLAQLDQLGARFGHDELHRRTGRGPSVAQAFPKLLWLVQHEPEVAARTYRFMDVHGFLVQRLTGAFTTSLASADSFGLTTGGPVGRRYLTDRSCRTLYGGAPDTFLFENVLRGGLATMRWFMRHVADGTGDGLGGPASFDRYEAAAREIGPGSDGLLLVPYWNHVTSPYWDPSASGVVVGWHHGHRREHLFRAIEEGIAYEHRLAMEGIQAATGQRIREYVILGGGSNSDLWCQIMADVLGATVTRAHTAEATNLGAGILCAFGVGWYPSVEEAAAAMTDVAERFQPLDPARALYDNLFTQVYRPLFPAIQPQLQRLSKLRAGSTETGSAESAAGGPAEEVG